MLPWYARSHKLSSKIMIRFYISISDIFIYCHCFEGPIVPAPNASRHSIKARSIDCEADMRYPLGISGIASLNIPRSKSSVVMRGLEKHHRGMVQEPAKNEPDTTRQLTTIFIRLFGIQYILIRSNKNWEMKNANQAYYSVVAPAVDPTSTGID